MKAFLTRLGSGILLVAIILVTGAYGSWPLWIAVTLAGFVGLHEFYRAVDIQKNDLLWWIGMIGTGMWAFHRMDCLRRRSGMERKSVAYTGCGIYADHGWNM